VHGLSPTSNGLSPQPRALTPPRKPSPPSLRAEKATVAGPPAGDATAMRVASPAVAGGETSLVAGREDALSAEVRCRHKQGG
jgi:hypothetical protein